MQNFTLEDLEEQGMSLKEGLSEIPEFMQRKLKSQGVKDLFPVQKAVYKYFTARTNDVVVKSKTGSGKTLGFLLPLEHLMREKEQSEGKIRCIILEPTRELALQVEE
mmetsp:Transcript_4225/g.7174  ORF Transcript_4225/g.7174 Transcript_4225/m.7174 type:complete len:107 (+) Transcript_4225:114-434(+)